MASNNADQPLLTTIVDDSVNSNCRCPTCQGTGLVSKSPGLVALIPFDDVRLKRRHTLLWTIFTILFCTLLASTIIAVILPRSVHLSVQNPLVIDVTNNSFRNATSLQLTFVHQMKIHSENWVPIRLINLTTSIEHQLVHTSPNAEKLYDNQMYVRPLGTSRTNLTVRVDFDATTMAYRVCQGIYRQMLIFKLQTTLTYADFLLGRIETTSHISYQYVLCNREEWKSHEDLRGNTTTSV